MDDCSGSFASRLPGRLVIVGFGSIGQAALPVLLRELALDPGRVTIVKAGPDASGQARAQRVRVIPTALTPANHEAVLGPLLGAGDFLLNLAVHVGSLTLMRMCRRVGALYLDTASEPWPGLYGNPELTLSQRSNYALREQVLALRRAPDNEGAPTAVITQGANPGIVSALLKQALLELARQQDAPVQAPRERGGWAALARRLGVKVIHVAERDTQCGGARRQAGEFVNTWSVDGFIDEALQPAELGWGSHERHWPADAQRHGFGCDAAILLRRPGAATRVRTWTPLAGPFHGFLITHAEAISIADYLTVREAGKVAYRPTVHYAYHPCDDAVLSLHELAGRDWQPQERHRILRDAIETGTDELGVLLMGMGRRVYWYGSRLSIAQARLMAPSNNATSLQVVGGILGGMAWALAHPRAGVVEPDEIDHPLVLDVARPYLGDVLGVWGDWSPLAGRSALYPEPLDADDPWQFVNFRVA